MHWLRPELDIRVCAPPPLLNQPVKWLLMLPVAANGHMMLLLTATTTRCRGISTAQTRTRGTSTTKTRRQDSPWRQAQAATITQQRTMQTQTQLQARRCELPWLVHEQALARHRLQAVQAAAAALACARPCVESSRSLPRSSAMQLALPRELQLLQVESTTATTSQPALPMTTTRATSKATTKVRRRATITAMGIAAMLQQRQAQAVTTADTTTARVATRQTRAPV